MSKRIVTVVAWIAVIAAAAGTGWKGREWFGGAAAHAPEPEDPLPTLPQGRPPAAGAPMVASTAPAALQLTSVETVAEQPVEDALQINGRLTLDALKVYKATTRVSGRVDRIDVFEGAPVRAGQPIGQIFSPEYISAQRELILARNAVRAVSGSAASDLAEDARATLEAARSRLAVLGITRAEIDALERDGVVQERMLVRAPIGGRLIKRDADPGAFLNVGDSIGTIADMSTLWFVGSVYPVNLPRIRVGDPVQISVDGVETAAPLAGRIGFIAPTVDPQTHTLPIRVELANRDGALKAEMFARARIQLARVALPVVPRRALIETGADAYVVLERQPGRFERVPVEYRDVGASDTLVITRGVAAGDRVVVDGSILMERQVAQQQRRAPGVVGGAPERAPAKTARAADAGLIP